jgi:hypothetical protein
LTLANSPRQNKKHARNDGQENRSASQPTFPVHLHIMANSIIRTNSLRHLLSFAGKSQSPNALSLPASLTSRA